MSPDNHVIRNHVLEDEQMPSLTVVSVNDAVLGCLAMHSIASHPACRSMNQRTKTAIR